MEITMSDKCSDSNGSAVGKVLVENERVRVTEWRFAKKGDNTGWHQHGYDYIVVPLFDGCLEIETEDGGKTISKLEHGVPYFRTAGVRHDVISANDFNCAFIETELLETEP